MTSMTSSMTSSILKIEIFKNCYKSQFLTDFDESGWKLKLSARILKKKFLVIISGIMTDVIKWRHQYIDILDSHLWRHKWRHRSRITKSKYVLERSYQDANLDIFVITIGSEINML